MITSRLLASRLRDVLGRFPAVALVGPRQVVRQRWRGQNLLVAAPPGVNAWFYRTSAGAEIDLLLELGPGERWPVEVKRSVGSPQPSKGFRIACDDVGASRRFVVYPGSQRYLIDRATEVVPLAALLESGFSAPQRRR